MAKRKGKQRPAYNFSLTPAGWAFMAVAMLIGLASVKSQAPLLFVVFGGMMGALHISALMARGMIRHTAVQRQMPTHVWQNQTVHIAYYLRNIRKRGSALGVTIQELATKGLEMSGGFCVHLPPGGVFRAGARFVAVRRGRIQLGRIRISTVFPLGLLKYSKTVRQDDALVVWPARGKLLRQLLRHGATETSSVLPSLVAGGQDEFFGVREYRQGDSPRMIHWKRSAGRSTPVVRELARPLPESLYVLLDTQCDGTQQAVEERERALRFAATIIDHAFAKGYGVGMAWADAAGAQLLLHAPGLGQRRALLDAIAELGNNPFHPLARTLAGFNPRLLSHAQVVLVSLAANPVADLPLNHLRSSCRHLAVVRGARMGDFFLDKPLAAPEEPPA